MSHCTSAGWRVHVTRSDVYMWHGTTCTCDMERRVHVTWNDVYMWHGATCTCDMGRRVHVTWSNGFVFTAEHFARNCWHRLRRSWLICRNEQLDSVKQTITSQYAGKLRCWWCYKGKFCRNEKMWITTMLVLLADVSIPDSKLQRSMCLQQSLSDARQKAV
jgi:hypothetical protein